MEKFKVGDKIRIKNAKELKGYDYSEPPCIVPEMKKYLGKSGKIIREVFLGFYLDIDDGEFEWSLKWIKKANKINIDDDLFKL